MGSEPTEILIDGTKIWRNERGEIHREDGPAVIYPNGKQCWYINGKFHREDGPAFISYGGTSVHYEYWFNNKHISEHIRKWAKERQVDLRNLTVEDKMLLKFEIIMEGNRHG